MESCCLSSAHSPWECGPVLQLQQKPGPQNPVFLPSDSGYDWLLAKMWVHSADFQCHQLISHYLRTHMMAELCCVATLRQLPDAHPLHQVNPAPLQLARLHPQEIREQNCCIQSFLLLNGLSCLFSHFFYGQLLLPHVKTSLKINFGARASLLASKGLFDQVKCRK